MEAFVQQALSKQGSDSLQREQKTNDTLNHYGFQELSCSHSVGLEWLAHDITLKFSPELQMWNHLEKTTEP